AYERGHYAARRTGTHEAIAARLSIKSARAAGDLCRCKRIDQLDRFARSCACSMVDRVRGRLLFADDFFPGYIVAAHSRPWNLGRQHSGGVGIRDCEFRLVDWHRPRRDIYLRHLAVNVSTLAHFD